MDTLLVQLNNNIEALKNGVEIRRRTRRNWMERLMQESETADEQQTSAQVANDSSDAESRH